jgi:hypothetical protein
MTDASEAQRILSMVNHMTTMLNNIDEACRDDFGGINVAIEVSNMSVTQLSKESSQLNSINQSEVSNESHTSSSSG